MTPGDEVKAPPTKILPSDCSAMSITWLLTPDPILNPVSSVPSAFNLVMRFCVTPLNVVNWPPTNILPSGCNAMASTVVLKPVPILKPVSRVPSVFNLVMRFCVTPLNVVKPPPTKIFPSGWTAMA